MCIELSYSKTENRLRLFKKESEKRRKICRNVDNSKIYIIKKYTLLINEYGINPKHVNIIII